MKPEETIAYLSVIKGIHRWLEQNGRGCFDKQKHVRAGSQEKIYWRYGYMVALMDVKCFLAGKDPNRSRLSRESHNSGSQDRS